MEENGNEEGPKKFDYL